MKACSIWIIPATLILAATQAASGQEMNVALAGNGATVRADCEFAENPGGPAVAARLIDGVIRRPGSPPEANRWHSRLSLPHPHWVWIRFSRPAKISKVVLWYSDIGAPVDFAGQCTVAGGRSLQTLFRRENAPLDAAHPSLTVAFAPVVTDNFRLLITRSSNKDYPNYTQLSEIQVFGAWAGQRIAATKPTPDRRRGEMLDGPLPEGLKVESAENEVAMVSPWLKVSFDLSRPSIRWFSVDGSGGGKHTKNLLKGTQGIDLVAKGWNEETSSAEASFIVSRSGNTVRYSGIRLGNLETADWAFTVGPRNLHVVMDRHVPAEYLTDESSPLRMLWDLSVTPATPMGRLKALGELSFPVLLHFPDHGTLLVRADDSDSTWKFVGRRGPREVELALEQGSHVTAEATTIQAAGRYHVELDMALTSIYPQKVLVDADPKLVGVKARLVERLRFPPGHRHAIEQLRERQCHLLPVRIRRPGVLHAAALR